MVDVFESYGLPTVKSNTLPKYNLVMIGGKDILPGIMAKLFETNLPTILKKGCIDLDEALYASTDTTIKAWIPHIDKEYPNKKPFGSRKLYIGNIKCNVKYEKMPEKSWFFGTDKGIGSFGVIFPYQMDDCLPDDLLKKIGDLSALPEVAADSVDKLIEAHFKENGYMEQEVSFFIRSDGDKNPLRDKTTATLKDLVKPDELRIDQTKAIVGFVAPRLSKKAETVQEAGKPDKIKITYSLNVDDIIFIKPKSIK